MMAFHLISAADLSEQPGPPLFELVNCYEGSNNVKDEEAFPIKTDEEFYRELERRKKNTRLCCDKCGERYLFDNINMCKRCGSVLCRHCVWEPDLHHTKRKCQCGGEMD